MSVRLTNEIRNSISSAILNRLFNDRLSKLKDEEATLAEVVYADLYLDGVQKQMHALPKGFLPSDNTLKIKSGDSYEFLKLKEHRLMAQMHYHNWIVYDVDHPIAERLFHCVKDKESLGNERVESRAQINAVLQSVTTIKKLIEVWPEVQEFAEPFETKTVCTALSLPIQELNTRLGLSR